ncbi:hypothetical protein JOC37_001855 [Desulfohalotomaculum tongense]|uniref:vitamin B12 dependent-methionine synthase activation domain-containing protein n=1 Tax=Desulforadius tongensis TaxID=1216062 RepID=UPI001957A210|nr:vitamin B12 dependent-methionine synthase activation domain-containing protein [Desulforadius tongensis]MBM7855460.1 hypothetical protein [Desulforadius tongensis]
MHIDKNEVLRYLGYKPGQTNLSSSMLEKVDYYISLGITLLEPDSTYRIFNRVKINAAGVELPEADLVLPGRNIVSHLQHCGKVCIVAATIGPRLEHKVTELFNRGEYAGSTILDAVGSDAVEKVADQLQEKLKALAAKQGYRITWRFCSGYGDLPLSTNQKLAAAVDAGRIGITVTETCMLLPQKSIIGIVGFNVKETGTRLTNKCAYCSATDCAYRNRGDKCAKANGNDP